MIVMFLCIIENLFFDWYFIMNFIIKIVDVIIKIMLLINIYI